VASCSTRRVAALGTLALWLTRNAAATAAELPGAHLSVSRGAGAETCPDADALAAELLQRVAPADADVLPLDLSVDVARDGDGFVAAIRVEGRKHGERLLRAEGPICDALHDALVVTILVLLDEERAATTTTAAPGAATIPSTAAPAAAPAVVPPPQAQREVPSEPAASAPQQVEKARPLPSLWLSAGGGATYGVPSAWSGVLLFDLAVRFGAFEVSTGAFWAPQKAIPPPVGDATVSAWGERARGCYAFSPEHARGTRLLGCAAGIHGALTGTVSGFVGAHSATQDWWLAGGSLEATFPLSPWIDVGISLSALATLHGERFYVQGLPHRVFETAPVVGIAAARLEARLF
jgi:hypothetical protein